MLYVDETNFEALFYNLMEALVHTEPVEVGEWQSKFARQEMNTTRELAVALEWPFPATKDQLQAEVEPNLPWAEDHFQERVSGLPYNPPPSHVDWPYAEIDNDEHTDEEGKFSHTYPERIFPQLAGRMAEYEGDNPFEKFWYHTTLKANKGIRFEYGGLGNLIRILRSRHHTRQAYLPIWFPEDLTAAEIGERVPCTLGYHFLVRPPNFIISYHMRSCDLMRYFRDDVYMAARLAQYLSNKVLEEESSPQFILRMHIDALHIFEEERDYLLQQLKDVKSQQLMKALG